MTLPYYCPAKISRPVTLVLALLVLMVATRAESASYFVMQPSAPLSGSPASLLMQSSILDVPAGAVLTVYLIQGANIISTSKLEFTKAYKSSPGLPTQVASFQSSGSSDVPGEPVEGGKLYSGITDLAPVVASPKQYEFLWTLSDGVIGTPGQVIVTGGAQTVSFVSLAAAPVARRQSDQKPGSVLFYHRYLSTIGATNGNNTTISLTNTSPALSAKVRMFFISAADCSPFEQAVCLIPQQTTTFVMSNFDPGTTGYCIAVACDSQGNPTQFNWLIGNMQIRQTSPLNGQLYDSSLSAIAVSKLSSSSVAATNNIAEMAFDDRMYDSLPSQLAADNVPSQGTNATNGNATLLTLYRPVANLAGGAPSAQVNLTIFSNTNQAVTTTQAVGCYTDFRLSSLRLNPSLASILSLGKTGWVRLSPNDNGPLLGAQFNSGQYVSGASLRAITYALDYRISIPIKAPGC